MPEEVLEAIRDIVLGGIPETVFGRVPEGLGIHISELLRKFLK